MTTTTEKRSGMKRDIIKLVCHKYMDKSHTTNKCPTSILLSGDTTAKLYFLRQGRSHSGSVLLNKRSLNLLPLFLLRRLFADLRGNVIVFVHHEARVNTDRQRLIVGLRLGLFAPVVLSAKERTPSAPYSASGGGVERSPPGGPFCLYPCI